MQCQRMWDQGQVRVGFRCLNCCSYCCSQQLQAGLAQVSHRAVPNLPTPFLLPQAPRSVQKGTTSPLLGGWDSSSVFGCELGLELQPLDRENPQQSLGSDSEPQRSLTPVTSLTVPPKGGV